MSASIVTNYAGASGDPHVISLSGKTAGRDLFVFFMVAATPTLPANWVEVDSHDAGAYMVKVWRLPAASNTAGVTSLTIDLNGARPLGAVVWQDDVDTGSIYVDVNERAPVSANPGLLGTGLHTFTERDESFALFGLIVDGGGAPNFATHDVASYDTSYTDFGDSGVAGSSAADSIHVWVARRENAAISNNGVTATANQTHVGQSIRGGGGMVAYNTVAPPPSGSYSDIVLADSPTYYWRMVETGTDLIRDETAPGNAARGLQTGSGVTPVTGALTGDANGASQFNGVSAQGYATQAGIALGNTNGAPLTFEAWVWWDAYADDDDMLIEFGQPWFQNAGTFVIDPNNSSGGGEANTVSIGFRTMGGAVYRATIARSALTAAAWHHLVVIMTPTVAAGSAETAIRVYVDGAAVTTTLRENQIGADSSFSDGAALSVMSRTTATLNAAGRLDEVALYPRALTVGEIGDHYTAGTTGGGGDAPPDNTAAPAVTGVPVVGQILSCSTGTWTGTPTPTYTYQWQRAGVNISGATANTYTIQVADVGQAVRCVVTGTNTEGAESANSNAVTPSAADGKLSIAAENALAAGITAPDMEITGAGDSANHGFCRQFSANVGTTVNFAIHSAAATQVDIVRVGHYGGVGWRKVAQIVNTPTTQPAPASIANSNGGVTCAGWSNTASWAIPDVATPGYYFAVIRSNPGPNASMIPFFVRDDARDADIMVKSSDATWALAYNYFNTAASPLTGKSLYGSGGAMGDITTRAHAATYLKPIVTRAGVAQTYPWYGELALIRYLDRMGFDYTVSTCKDWATSGARNTLADCKIYVSVGHDEYWDQTMRDEWYALRTAGKKLIFMSGNQNFWRTRFPDSDKNTMWCFKDSMSGPSSHVAGTALDPVSWTGTWKDTRAANNATRDPEWNLTGLDFRMNGVNYKPLVVPAGGAGAHASFWRNTSVMTNGITVQDLIGMEADEMRPQQPAENRTTLATTTPNIDDNRADDNGEVYNLDGNLAWGIVFQRYENNGVVVGFGTCTWSWGLDNRHDVTGAGAATRETLAIQQATANLLVDLGAATPATPISGLTTPSAVSLNLYAAPVTSDLGVTWSVNIDGQWQPLTTSVVSLPGPGDISLSMLSSEVKAVLKAFVYDSGSGYGARPSGFGSVEFIGPSDPGGLAQNGDTWVDTTP